MTVIEHERVDAGKDNAPRVLHMRTPGVPYTYCGKPIRAEGRLFKSGTPLPPHQLCVVCTDLAGLS